VPSRFTFLQFVGGYSDGLQAGWPGFDSLKGQGLSLLQSVHTGSGAHPVSYTMGTGGGAISPGKKRPGREADHSPQSSAEIKKCWSYASILPYVFMA
jgi:hypothetical protein